MPVNGDEEIVPDNIRAVGLIYAAYQLERLRLFEVSGAEPPAGREALYARMLDADFERLWRRFLESLAAYAHPDGKRRPAGKGVRATGRELAVCLSRRGSAETRVAAHRLGEAVQVAMDLLRGPELLARYGVQSPWDVIERAGREVGRAPEVERRRTLAHSGKRILDLLAEYVLTWDEEDVPPEDRAELVRRASQSLDVARKRRAARLRRR